MHCPSCQRENPQQARFCNGCGAALEAQCGACGHANPPDSSFCNACGQRIGPVPEASEPSPTPRAYTPKHLAERILSDRAALEGERKHVTVLFADLRDSTPLGERLDPEEMHALMDRCFGLILEQVHRYEGTVNQFLGDGVMALFGAPIALEAAPRRAVLAALAIQRALEPLNREVQAQHGCDFRMRIGIHTGPVVVGRIGDDLRMDYTAVGDTTNLAARLQQTAPPGSILISEATENLVAGFFELRDLGALGLKGKTGAVRAFEVLDERAVSGRIQAAAAEAGLTPYIGRSREREALRDAYESAREGRGRVVFVVGEAGLGKSRLLYEFEHGLAGEPHTWFEGHCSAYGQATAFQAIRDGLRRQVGIEERDDDARAIEKLAHFEEEQGGELTWTLPFIRQLLSLPVGDAEVEAMEAGTRRSETFRALQAHFLRATRHEPMVLVIEDLHWIDPASEEFLAFLADSVPASRALLLFTYRPGYRQPFGDRSYHVRLALQPLSSGEMSDMTGSLLDAPAVPAALRGLIAEKAEGNPFFVEEVTKSLIEAGVLHIEDGRVELTQELSTIAVPDSIQDVLMARIDRLAEEPKRAIQVASVIGREFALRLLEKISEAGDKVRGVVEDLRALELIYEKAAHPELAFMFKHALTHDVAYESVLVQRRKALHSIVGTAIEELYADRLAEHYEALAHHFERGDDWERAILYHERAGDKAADAYANQSAVTHYCEALAIAERLGDAASTEQRLRIEENLAAVHFCVSEFRPCAEAYHRAADLCAKGAQRARNLARAAFSYVWAHDYEALADTGREAITLAREHDAPAAECMVRVAHDLGDIACTGPRGRTDVGAETLKLAERTGDAEAIIYASSQRALYLEGGGAYREAISLSERALELARGQRMSLLTIYPHWALGLSLACVGAYGRALEVLQRALDHCERAGERALKARLLNSLGWCYAEFNCHEVAAEYNRRGEELGREMVELDLVAGAPELHANAAINLANNFTALGEVERARDTLEPIQAALDEPGDPWQRWRYALHVHDGLARVALVQGDPERALALVDQELEGARFHGPVKLEARALELRGRALVAMDQRDDAGNALREALALARRIEYPPVVWRSLSLLAECARRSGERAEAEQHAAQARGLVGELAQTIAQPELRSEFGAHGERLASDPLGAYR
jgi:class 3 adenylate cyclase/tetratricopeptide (TPR) repeat protein